MKLFEPIGFPSFFGELTCSNLEFNWLINSPSALFVLVGV